MLQSVRKTKKQPKSYDFDCLHGGATRNRTGDRGVADLCLTAWPWPKNLFLLGFSPFFMIFYDTYALWVVIWVVIITPHIIYNTIIDQVFKKIKSLFNIFLHLSLHFHKKLSQNRSNLPL